MFFSTIISAIIFYFVKYYDAQRLTSSSSVFFSLRYILLTAILISFFIFLFTFWLYCQISQQLIYSNLFNIILFSYFFELNFFYFNLYFSLDFFGFVLLFLAYAVGFISLLALDTRLYWRNIKFLFSFNIFVIIVFFFVTVTNIMLFFYFMNFY